MGYAEGTSVSVDASIAEIKKTINRFGADGFQLFEFKNKASVLFFYQEKIAKMEITLPDKRDEKFTLTPTGKERSAKGAYEAWEKECRRKWRELALIMKAKLIAVQNEVVPFEHEFMPYLVTKSRQTVAEILQPQLSNVLESGSAKNVFGLLGPKKK